MTLAPPVNGGTRLLFPTLVLLLSIFALAPLTYPGSFQTHSGFNAIFNLMGLHSQLGAVGWAPVFGRGFDPLRMDGALPYAFAESAHLLGLSYNDSIKFAFAAAFLASAIGAYWLGLRILQNEWAALLTAIVYVYLPYHLAIVYVRGAFGEAFVWALLPLAGLAMTVIASRPKLFDYVPIVLVFAVLALTQLGLTCILAIVISLAHWLLGRANRPRPPVERAAFAGILVGGVLLIPTVLRNLTTGGSYDFTAAFVQPFQFLTASSGSALPKGSFLDQFPYQLGIAPLALIVLAVALGMRSGEGIRRIVVYSVTGILLVLLLMMPAAAPLWSLTGAQVLVEYPFQLLLLVGLPLALAAGSVVAADTRFSDLPLAAALIIIPILAVYPTLAPEYIDNVPSRPPLAVFNQNEIALVGYRINRPPGTFRHGATVELELEWQSLRTINHDYTVFVHVVDENGTTWGGEDSKPQDGALPTTEWTRGKIITDVHTVQIDLAGPPEGYHLEVGMYTAVNGERAVTQNGATSIIIQENRE